MKYIYITILVFVLISCGKVEKESEVKTETKNLMVSPASEEGGGFGTPEKETGVR